MKKCDHFKDLLLTNYIDGELDKNLASQLEDHLFACSACRDFLKEVKDNTSLPFQQGQLQTVPTELWDMILQRIELENKTVSPIEGFIERLKGLFVLPRMVPVFASLILMFVIGSVTLNTMHLRQAQAKDQGEYLVSLMSQVSLADNNEQGTPIEQYFL